MGAASSGEGWRREQEEARARAARKQSFLAGVGAEMAGEMLAMAIEAARSNYVDSRAAANTALEADNAQRLEALLADERRVEREIPGLGYQGTYAGDLMADEHRAGVKAVRRQLMARINVRARAVDMAVHIAQIAATEVNKVDPFAKHQLLYKMSMETGYRRPDPPSNSNGIYNFAIHGGEKHSFRGADSRGHLYLSSAGHILRFTFDLNNPYNKPPYWIDMGRYVNLTNYFGGSDLSWSHMKDDNLYEFIGYGKVRCIEYKATPFVFENYDKLTTFGGEDVCLKGTQICVCNSNGIYSTDGLFTSTTIQNLKSIYWNGTDLYVSNENQIVKNDLTDAVTYAGSATTSGQNGGLLTNAKFTTTKAFAKTSGGVEYILDDTGIWRIQTEYVNEVFKPYGTNDAFAVNSLNMYVSSGGNVKQISLYNSTETIIPGVTNPKGITMDANSAIYVADSGNNAIYKKSSSGTTLQIYIPNTADNLITSPIQYLKNNISEYVVCSNNIILITPPTADFAQISVISKNTGKNVMVNANLYTPTIDTRAGATTTYVSSTQLNQLKTGGNSFVPLNFLEIDLGKEFIIESIVYYIKPGQNINASLYFYDNKRIMSIDPIINYSLLNSVPTNLQQINYVFQNIYPITYTKARYIGVATTGKTSQVAVINSAGLNVALMRMTGAINPTDGTYENKSTPLSYSGTFTIDLGTEHEIRKVVYYNAVDALTTTDPVEQALVSTYSGNGTPGFVSGSAKDAQFRQPISMVFDSSGNMYVSDHSNHCIRKITPDGIVTRFAGSGTPTWVDGTGAGASFKGPVGLAIDSANNIYVADQFNYCIRKITPGGVVSTIAGTGGVFGFSGDGGPATSAKLRNPAGVAVDTAGNVYITDQANHRIRKVSGGIITTFAGSGTGTLANGTGTAASFSSPSGITIDSSGNLYIGDQWNHSIRMITPGGVVSTIAGTNTAGYVDGTGAAARFNQPYGLVLDSNRNIYVGDFANNRIRKITQAGVVTTIAGSGMGGFINGLGSAASFNGPYGIAMDNTGSLYVAEWNNHSIRKLTSTSASIILINSLGIQVESRPFVGGLTKEVFDFRLSTQESGLVNLAPSKPVTGIRYVQYTPNEMAAIRQIVVYDKNGANIAVGSVSTLAGNGLTTPFANGPGTSASFNYPFGVAVDSAGNIYVTDQINHRIRMITPQGGVSTFAGTGTAGSGDGPRANATFDYPLGICIDSANNIYVADHNNAKIRRITSAGVVSTIVSSGINGPYGVAVDSAGNLYIADWYNHRIVKATLSGGTYTTSVFAGGGAAGNTSGNAIGTGTAALFRYPCGIAVDPAGNVYITDVVNHLIRKITPGRVVTTLAGSGTGATSWVGAFADGIGTNASFSAPSHIVIDSHGNLFVTDSANQRIRKVTPDGVVTTIAGSGSPTWVDGVATAAGFSNPAGIAIDASGNIYFVDRNNHRIRKLTNSQITDRVYKLNSPDTEIYPPLPATTALSTTMTSTSPPQPITIDLGAEYDITGISIITTPNYIPRLIDSRVRLLNASSIQQQECILRGGNVREDILFTYTYNTMARYIRIENPLPSFFAANEYNNTSGSMNISSFEAYDIYGKNILEGKPYRFSTASNYTSSSINQVLPTYINTNAKWIEYDIGKDTAIYSVKLTSNKLSSNQEINHRFMKNAPIIFYNETRGQTKKYFFTNPYIPYVNGVATATILPYIHVINRGNFMLNTNPTERLDIRLDNQLTAQPFTFKTMGAGTLSFQFNINNMYNVNPYTISVTNTKTGSSNTYTATANITLPEPEYMITITFNGNSNTEYYSACNAIQPKINDVRKWYDKETNVIMRNYQRNGYSRVMWYNEWTMSYGTAIVFYWEWVGVNVYMILLNSPWGNPMAKYGYPVGSRILEREPFRGIGSDLSAYHGPRKMNPFLFIFAAILFVALAGIAAFVVLPAITAGAAAATAAGVAVSTAAVATAEAAVLAAGGAGFAAAAAGAATTAAITSVAASAAAVAATAGAVAALPGALLAGAIVTFVAVSAGAGIEVSDSYNQAIQRMTDAEKDRMRIARYASISAAVAVTLQQGNSVSDAQATLTGQGASAGQAAGALMGISVANEWRGKAIDAVTAAALKGATAGADAGNVLEGGGSGGGATAAGAAAGAAAAAEAAAKILGISYILGDASAIGALAATASVATTREGVFGNVNYMALAAGNSVISELIKNEFDPLSHVRGPSWLWADYSVFGMRMARPFDIQEFVWEDGFIQEDDIDNVYVDKIKSRYISARYLDAFKVYMTETWNVSASTAQKYNTSLISLNAARDAVTRDKIKYISTNNSWIQINQIPVPSTNTNPTISSDLFPQLLSQSIATTFPDQQTSVIATGLTSVQYISFSFTSQIKLNQIAVIDKRGINVAAGKPLVLISNSSVNTALTNGNYYTQITISSFVLDLGAAYDISTISIYNFESTTQTNIITLHIYKSDRTWHTLVANVAANQSLIQKGQGPDRYIVGVPSTAISLYSIYFNNPFHDSCKPQHAGVGSILRYITMSEMNIRVCVTNTAGQILWNDPINDELDLGEEHNIASIYVGNTTATIISLKNAYKIAVPIPVPSSIAGVTTGAPIISFTPSYRVYSFI